MGLVRFTSRQVFRGNSHSGVEHGNEGAPGLTGQLSNKISFAPPLTMVLACSPHLYHNVRSLHRFSLDLP
jgi:hypothetical protein